MAKVKTNPKKYEGQKIKTAKNKIKAIQKVLLIAGGQQIQRLENRLKYWQNGGKK